MPHWNELVEKFKDKDVVFLAVTFEPEDHVKGFFEEEELEMKGWIGCDTDMSLSNAYGVNRYPQTVLLYPGGKIASYTSPKKLDAETVQKLIDKKPL